MRMQPQSVLGVDIAPGEVRVAEVSGRWPDVRITHAGSEVLRAGAVEGGRVTDPDIVAAAIRVIINRQGISTRDAVIGIADRGVIARMLEVPKVPEAEIRTIVQGELEHYQVIRPGGGSFDMVRLTEGEQAASRQALVMAAEDIVVRGYQAVAERAGLKLLALEPNALACMRLALLRLHAQPSALCLSVSYGRSEVVFLDGGSLRLFRRIDTGTGDLIRGRAGSQNGQAGAAVSERILLGHDEDQADERDTGGDGDTGPFNPTAANGLAIELQRSMDYYRREFPEGGGITGALVVTNDPEAEPLAEWLAEALHVDIAVAPLPPGAPNLTRDLEMPMGLRYSAAAGLALRDLAGLPTTCPRFDLSTKERVEPALEIARGKVALSLVLSLLFVLAGTFSAYKFGVRANSAQHTAEHRDTYLKAVQAQATERTKAVAREKALADAVTNGAFSTPRLMDRIAASVDLGAGLTEFSVDRAGKVSIKGEAADERGVIRTLEDLKRLPVLSSATLVSYDNTAATHGGTQGPNLAHFEITAQVAGVSAPQTAAADGAGGTR